MEASRRIRWLALLVLLTACASPSCAKGIGQVDNVITRWNAVNQQVTRTVGIPNQIAARIFSLLHLSQYKALQLAYKKGVPHPDAAAAYAAHYVLSEIFPAQQSQIFDSLLADEIYPLNFSGKQDAEIRAIGLAFAKELLKSRTSDGSQNWYKFKVAPPGSPAGEYQYTPNQTFLVYPQLKDTKPFVSKPVKAYDIYGGPPKIPSARYNADYNTVAEVGDASAPTHTLAESETAWFWEDAAGTAQLASHLFNVSIAAVGKKLTVKETARLFANLAVANFEAHIAAWYQKYKYLFWRPVTAFRQGDPSHKPRPGFRSAINPPAEPEYPSGHGASGGAYAAVVSAFLGKAPGDAAPNGPYVVATESPHNLPPRTFTTIDEPAKQIPLSRVYGGIHLPNSAQVGYKLGFAVGKYDWEHFEEVYGAL